jgi:hypothetical protein
MPKTDYVMPKIGERFQYDGDTHTLARCRMIDGKFVYDLTNNRTGRIVLAVKIEDFAER